MKILLINPENPVSSKKGVIGLERFIKAPPLGLMSIAATVPEHDVEILDLKYRKLSTSKISNKIASADVIGVTNLTPSTSTTGEICKIAKEHDVTTIVGGYQPSLVPETIEKPEIDYIVRGEGEHTFPELIKAIETGSSVKDILGISYTEDGSVYHNEARPLIEDLDTLPFPNRNLVKNNSYTYFGASVDAMESARGCTHNCHFCCVSRLHHRQWRPKSPERVIQELQKMNKRKFWHIFYDSSFTLNMKRVGRICDLIIEHGLERKWYSAQGRVDDVVKNPDIVDKMQNAGFKMLFIGIESVYQKSLEIIGKKITIEQIKEAVKMLHDRGITIFGSIIIGNIGESKEDVLNTIQFAKDLDIDIMQFTPLTPYPQTQLYEEATEKGWIKEPNFDKWNLVDPIMATPDLSIDEIRELVIKAYRSFYLEGVFNGFLLRKLPQFLQPQFLWFWRMVPGFLVNTLSNIWAFVREIG